MPKTTQIAPPVAARAAPVRPSRIPLLLAFFAVYIIWGTTFLAIRVAVEELPPLFAAATRFLTAGAILYAFMRLRGTPRPDLAQWRSLALMALLMFTADYGALFWAEKYVPSGIASILMATLPLMTIVLEMFIFRQQPFQKRLVFAVILGFCGTALLLYPSRNQHFSLIPCLVILGGAAAWALGAVLSRTLALPSSKALTAGAAMMLGGATLLAVSAAFGELHPWPHISLRAAGAELYLIVCGSLLGFTAFVWLLARMPATRVSSHAYVNPVVAVALGYFAAGEAITARMVGGAAVVLVSIFLVLSKEKDPA